VCRNSFHAIGTPLLSEANVLKTRLVTGIVCSACSVASVGMGSTDRMLASLGSRSSVTVLRVFVFGLRGGKGSCSGPVVPSARTPKGCSARISLSGWGDFVPSLRGFSALLGDLALAVAGGAVFSDSDEEAVDAVPTLGFLSDFAVLLNAPLNPESISVLL